MEKSIITNPHCPSDERAKFATPSMKHVSVSAPARMAQIKSRLLTLLALSSVVLGMCVPLLGQGVDVPLRVGEYGGSLARVSLQRGRGQRADGFLCLTP